MKFYESHYEEYLDASNKRNFHPEIKIPAILNNTIIYGSSGAGKYTQTLRMLAPHSPSGLKYEKRITVATDKMEYTYHISDIHYEVDMALLGCNAKTVWHELYSQIMDIISVKADKTGYIVCKNFHAIHPELLNVIYSYISDTHAKFIILTEHLSFIPNSILRSFAIVNVRRINTQITNAKSLKVADGGIFKDRFHTICGNIIAEMEAPTPSLARLRETSYDILSYNLDAHECVWYILSHFTEKGKIHQTNAMLDRVYVFLKYFNNNYRPIYHLESILLYITTEALRK